MASTFSIRSQMVQGRYMYLACTQKQNVAANASQVDWTLTVTGGSSAYYTTGPTTVTINGEVVYYKERTSYTTGQFPAAKGSVSATAVVPHDDSGNAKIEVCITTMIYNGVIATHSGTWELDSITRFAAITKAPDFTDEENPTISYANYAGSLVTGLQAAISADGETPLVPYREIPKDAQSYTFSLTEAERSALRAAASSSNTLQVFFLLKTAIADTTGVVSAQALMQIINALPQVTPSIVDVNPVTVAVTGDASVLVAQYSNAQVRINAAAQKGASIVSQKVAQGSFVMDGDGEFFVANAEPIYITVTDSRGNAVVFQASNEVVPYFDPVSFIEHTMPDGDGEMPLTVTGKFYNGGLGSRENALTVQYRYKTGYGQYGDWKTVADVTAAGNDFTAQTLVTGLDYKQRHTFQARAIDALVEEGVFSAEKTFIAVPVFDWGPEDFQFNVPVSVPKVTGLAAPETGGDAANKAYVDVQAEAVEALINGKVSMTLLWENASPNSSFAAQALSLPLSDYTYVAMEAKWVASDTWDTQEVKLFRKGSSSDGRMLGFVGADTGITSRRIAAITDTEIIFSKGITWSLSGAYLHDNDAVALPIRIYGIKGVEE